MNKTGQCIKFLELIASWSSCQYISGLLSQIQKKTLPKNGGAHAND